MKKTLLITISFLLGFILTACGGNVTQQSTKSSDAVQKASPASTAAEAQALNGTHTILVAYFSHSGNTRSIANQIHQAVGGDMFEIKPLKPYDADYETTLDEAQKEHRANARPALAAKVENMQDYDVIFLGFPNWCGAMPMTLFTFMEQHDFKGKTIVPFCTHGSSGLSSTVEDLKRLSPEADIKEALGIHRQDVRNADNTVSTWLRKLGYMN